MQRIGNDFLVKRSVQIYSQDGGGMIKELFELPNGQWQFGKGKDAQVVTSLEQVKEFDEGTQTAVSKWLERIKHQPTPQPVTAGGPTPVLAGDTARDQLSRAISKMPEEVVNRLLTAITQTMGPVADSITQESPINHHSDGFGQDQNNPPLPEGASVIPRATDVLPEGAWWADPGNKAAGYFTHDYEHMEKAKLPSGEIVDVPTRKWHPTGSFQRMQYEAPEKTAAELEMDVERAKRQEEEQEREVVTAGIRPRRRR